ncbi:hypothetical protein, partial [Staphylococcus aureus]|uniref:hypothetical protein n=1 Tax=Staphylococcus aureus TaxID=1280 RepID=UPI0038B2BBA8
ARNVGIFINAQSLETGKSKVLALTMLGLAAGGGLFSLRNGSTWFASAQTGYPLIFPRTLRAASVAIPSRVHLEAEAM